MKKIIILCGLALLILSFSAYALPTGFQPFSSHARGERSQNIGWVGDNSDSNFGHGMVDLNAYHHPMYLRWGQNMSPTVPQCPVPEPMTLTLFGLGALGLSLIRKPNK
jgi:hypothetical protein